VARRCAEQEVDPRFSRLAALTLVNQTAASHLGIETGARKANPQTLQFRRRPREEERRSEFFASGIASARAARSSFGDFGPLFLLATGYWLSAIRYPLSAIRRLLTLLASSF
jgi:hypothetical protein